MSGTYLKCCVYQSSDNSGERYDPYRNLAIEDFLVQYVEERAQDEMAVLFLWQNVDCVVFGRNQNPSNECRLDFMRELGVLPVRRKTGGGAVFHDLQNLNFSFIVPENDYDKDRSMQIVVRALRMCGIDAAVTGRNDIVVGDSKVSGNAYLSRNGVCLHHGTLLIAADTAKMERLLTVDAEKFAGKGISSVRSRVKNLSEIRPDLTVEDYGKALSECFLECYAGCDDAALIPLVFGREEMDQIRRIQEEYASEAWIFGHEMGQVWKKSRRFDWGNCTVEYTGDSYNVYSDTLDTEDFAQIRNIVRSQDFYRMCMEGCCVEERTGVTDTQQKRMLEDICRLIETGLNNKVEVR